MLLEASKFPALYPRADTCTCAMHWHVRLKSMTSWMTSPSTLSLTQFLRPDPNLWLGSNHLQKKKKKGKKKALTKLDLWLWPKSQNFQNRPVLLSFSSIFQFWDPFLHSKLKNCANVQFPKVDFCTNVDQMSKFLRWTYLAQFFAYIPILESVPSFKTWKLHKWLNSKVVDFCVEVDLKSRFSN